MKRLTKNGSDTENIVAVLDVGSTKTACIIAKYAPEIEAEDFFNRASDLDIIGVGIHRSGGIKSGVVVDLEKAAYAIGTAVSEAERAAGIMINNVILLASCGRVKSVNFAASDEIEQDAVTQADIDKVIRVGETIASADSQEILHIFPIGFRLDESSGVTDPRGMLGATLATDIHAVTVRKSLISNMLLAVTGSGLSVSNIIASSYASAIATIVPEEANLGVTCVDIGGGVTKFAVFAEGHFIYSDTFPMGAHHITLDIAGALGASIEEAERIKTLCGNLVSAGSDSEQLVTVARVSDPTGHDNCLTRAQLAMLIRPRVEEILSTVQDRLERSGFSIFAGRRVVLTGGGANMAGLDQFAAQFLDKPVRIGQPFSVPNLPDVAAGPAYASSLGGVFYNLYPRPLFGSDFHDRDSYVPRGYLEQIREWLIGSF